MQQNLVSIVSARSSHTASSLEIRYRISNEDVQINYRMRVTLNDGRQMTGQMLAFDKV